MNTAEKAEYNFSLAINKTVNGEMDVTWFIRITSAKTAAKNTRMSALGTVSPHHTPKRKWVFHMGVPQLFNLMKPKQSFSSDLRKLRPRSQS